MTNLVANLWWILPLLAFAVAGVTHIASLAGRVERQYQNMTTPVRVARREG